jgi:hypothetical protein
MGRYESIRCCPVLLASYRSLLQSFLQQQSLLQQMSGVFRLTDSNCILVSVLNPCQSEFLWSSMTNILSDSDSCLYLLVQVVQENFVSALKDEFVWSCLKVSGPSSSYSVKVKGLLVVRSTRQFVGLLAGFPRSSFWSSVWCSTCSSTMSNAALERAAERNSKPFQGAPICQVCKIYPRLG